MSEDLTAVLAPDATPHGPDLHSVPTGPDAHGPGPGAPEPPPVPEPPKGGLKVDMAEVTVGGGTSANAPEDKSAKPEKKGFSLRRKAKEIIAPEPGKPEDTGAVERFVPQDVIDQHATFLRRYVNDMLKTPDRSIYQGPGFEVQQRLLSMLTDTPEGGTLQVSGEKIEKFLMQEGGEGLILADNIMMMDAGEKMMALGIAETFSGKTTGEAQKTPGDAFNTETTPDTSGPLVRGFRKLVTGTGPRGLAARAGVAIGGAAAGGLAGTGIQEMGESAAHGIADVDGTALLSDVADLAESLFITHGGTTIGMAAGGAAALAATASARASAKAAANAPSPEYQVFADGLEAIQADPHRARDFFIRTGVQPMDWEDDGTGKIVNTKDIDPSYIPETKNLDSVRQQILDAVATRRKLYESLGMPIGKDAAVEQQLFTRIADNGERQHATRFDHEVHLRLDPNEPAYQSATPIQRIEMLADAKRAVMLEKLENYADLTEKSAPPGDSRIVETIEARINKAMSGEGPKVAAERDRALFEGDRAIFSGEETGRPGIMDSFDAYDAHTRSQGEISAENKAKFVGETSDTLKAQIDTLTGDRKALLEERRNELKAIKMPDPDAISHRIAQGNKRIARTQQEQDDYLNAYIRGETARVNNAYDVELSDLEARIAELNQARAAVSAGSHAEGAAGQAAKQEREQFVKGKDVVYGKAEFDTIDHSSSLDHAHYGKPIKTLFEEAKKAGHDVSDPGERERLIKAAIYSRSTERAAGAPARADRYDFVREAAREIQTEIEQAILELNNVKDSDKSAEVRQAEKVVEVAKRRETLMSKTTELNAKEGFDSASFFNKGDVVTKDKSQAEIDFANDPANAGRTPEFYYKMLDFMFDYQNNPAAPDREGSFATISTLIPPDKMAAQLSDLYGLAVGTDLKSVVDQIVTNGQTDERDLRRITKHIVHELIVETGAKAIK